MEGWGDFFMLAGLTAGTLIGLIFVVIALGSEHIIEGDETRIRLFITPILFMFTSIFLVALVAVASVSAPVRAIGLGLIGCGGLGYIMNLALTVLFPIAAFALLATAAAAWALQASFANAICAASVVLLLVTAIRNSWVVTLAIASRRN
jgi:hypothetical protein